ncbi:hypothetical protein F7O44_25045 [Phytoactinopolyspora sp. XMNu-373]|uniref:Extradiol ring-cleavage dioxygenase LigAB LigA subunit domain-containing protein n=1 Tax=Phytoactinopolyspora mesophila TaxID=2650750 RepID=A0A7K3MBF2_9ACTN|nr:hypothetical protein [Phytoactinopolyspora mesophila]NDL60347.1 hypothetical protein [Phytoactinopolyspora mesophila]
MAGRVCHRRRGEVIAVYDLQKLLWDVRKDLDLANRFRSEPDAVLDEYGIDGEERAAMKALDFKTLYERGANPYLLYFCALQIGVDRAEYYAKLRGEVS